MYLAVDIGGSKTLLAVFDKHGQIIKEQKFPTPKDYQEFLATLISAATALKPDPGFAAIAVAAPGKIDRKSGVALDFGNLPWHDVNLKTDLEPVAGYAPVFIENDANLAGLSEALLVHNQYKKVLYLTVSTGIGDGIIINGIIDPDFADSEPGQMVLEHKGSLQKWEDFASGRALKEKYGKKASEIDDPAIWKEFVKGLAQGIGELVATLMPEVIIVGGGVGAHFDKFGSFLADELKLYENNMVKIPPIIEAQRPEEAVVYGCYDLIKQHL
ncbi:MAG TPA: ROK family protein [Candidatus Saccharimonadales bacterium]|nr:ROK family protein [Candidatus Saccharimonadales bacterium]